MLECTYLLLCSKIIIDRETGAISLIELIDMARLPPGLLAHRVVAPIEFCIVSGWRRDNDTPPLAFPTRFTISGPQGKAYLGEQQMRLDPNHLGASGMKVQGVPIDGPGQYKIGVEWLDPQAEAWKEGPWAGLWIPTVEETVSDAAGQHSALHDDLLTVIRHATAPLAPWDALVALEQLNPNRYRGTDLTTAAVSVALDNLVLRGVVARLQGNAYALIEPPST